MVDWRINSVSVVSSRVEVMRSGMVVDELRRDKLSCQGQSAIHVTESCWLAIRVRGRVAGRVAGIAAHTSAVFVEVGERPIFATSDAVAILAHLESLPGYSSSESR